MNTVIESIMTVNERDLLLNFLDQFDRIIFDSKIDMKSFVSQLQDAGTRDSLLSYFGEDLDNKNSEALFTKSKDLKEALRILKEVVIVGTLPTDKAVGPVSVQLKSLTDIPVIIQYSTDESLVGGATVESRGFLVEHSFRNYFEKRKIERRGAIHGF